MDWRNKQLTVLWQGCDPQHGSQISYSVFEELPGSRKKQLLEQARHLPEVQEMFEKSELPVSDHEFSLVHPVA
ncbi:unnamed protein product [Ambrosiozyma monospora]|uniref:Unnamed protein product n=1 Tax=Ambrosiozyma monospora TaxID=43982 RepID=A0A9W6WL10_AMBMO|nr:unnamed protein product [Ambrosiozyma monospora]